MALLGLRAANEINKQLKKKDKNKKTKKRKGRPTCKKDLEEEKKVQYTNPKYKYYQLLIDKLENMQTILTVDGGMSNNIEIKGI